MRRKTNRMGAMRRSAAVLSATALLAALSGCTESVGGMPRAGAEALAVDAYGCPNLDGGFALLPPDEQGHHPRRSVQEGLSEALGGAPVERVRGVRVRRLPAGVYEFRFVLPDSDVAESLRALRVSDRPRYSEWYYALQPQRRAAYIAEYGEARYAELLRALGPQAEVVTVVRSGIGGVTCRDGWLELPREYADPIRLTRGADGSILGEAGQLQTYDIPIWCGDGCKDLPIPTGTYTATLRWPRDDALQPWDALASGTAIERPLDEIEAEQRAAKRAQQRADSARYLANGSIRERLQALAPEDTRVDAVDVTDGRVFVRYVAPTEQTETLLRRIEQAGEGVPGSRPQQVRIIVATSRQFERTVEFVLTDSPLVLRDPPAPRTAAAADAASADAASAGGAEMPAVSSSSGRAGEGAGTQQVLAPLSAAPARADAATANASETPPPGQAEAGLVVDRAQALFPAGCRVTAARWRGGKLILSGQADALACVSDGLRALDVRQSRPELLSVNQGEGGARSFRILIAPSTFTAR